MSDIPNAEEQVPSIEEIFKQVESLPPEQQVPALIAISQALIGQMAELDARLSAMDKEIHEEFFGPINEHYQKQVRSRGIDGMKGKYGSMFDELAEPLKAFGVDDVYSFLYDKLEELKKGEGYTDELGEQSVKDFHAGALDRIGKIRGPAKEAEKPAAVAGETKTVETKPTSAGEDLRKKKLSMRDGM